MSNLYEGSSFPANITSRIEQNILVSRILALVLESTFFGIFIVAYSMAAGELLRGYRPSRTTRRNVILFGVNTLMFGLAMTHLTRSVNDTLDLFVADGADKESLPQLFSLNWATNIELFYIYVTQAFGGDAFIIYRLFVVWKVVVLPSILMLTNAGVDYAFMLVEALNSLIIFNGTSLENVFYTALTIWSPPVWSEPHLYLSRACFSLVRYRRVIEAILQSAEIYWTASISLTVMLFLGSSSYYISCLAISPHLIGVIFSLISIQIARASSAQGNPSDESRARPLPKVSPSHVPNQLPELLSGREGVL
ncbi:hypothetical protein L226DRAFT_614682 [Lentinus tigrinus ALCF2SS1-7]|uniref:Uncharacterized protein n=1 Tax=Lentinus tigrinus ALCF2SS1-6 TaxID=1328759 RepID=A0A5C2S4G2_9APHY|nr:hypothetical protein L227DRAFT_612653 [Lentinus tigrinus ALCF2SS1-6]RPD72825.1 hypothetical protein L226DRAFT_614682 [Lentinus tigrinus ALCF2SS1-7]